MTFRYQAGQGSLAVGRCRQAGYGGVGRYFEGSEADEYSTCLQQLQPQSVAVFMVTVGGDEAAGVEW